MENTKIDDKFLEKIRTYEWQLSIDFGKPAEDIVPEKFNHEYLFDRFSIDQSIKKWYTSSGQGYTATNMMSTKLIGGYYSLCKSGLSPYPFKICGAYICRSTLWLKLYDIYNDKGRYHLNGNFKLEKLNDLSPYFYEFAKGFKKANETFQEECIIPFLPKGFDKYDIAQKIFEFVTNINSLGYNWRIIRGFITTDGTKKLGIINAYENGQYDGYFYKAWSIIFSNNHLYAPLFKNLLQNYNAKVSAKNKKPLTLKEIALKYVYEGITITNENMNSIAEEHEYKSGSKLHQYFREYSSRANRKGIPKNCTATIIKNKIKLIESVIQVLSEEHKQRAIDEVNILKIRFKSDDY